jgi:hypothetical protein
LPKHLGGETYRPLDARERRKKLIRDQRFMARLDKHAHTLTGALGAPLQRIVITQAQAGKPATSAKGKAAAAAAASAPQVGALPSSLHVGKADMRSRRSTRNPRRQRTRGIVRG